MKKSFLGLLFLSLCFSLFAVPGTILYIDDIPGEYVYYRDYSFNRESYVGILTYDESTYQIRYYAPFDKINMLPEKSISILVAVNPDSDFWDMTGERVLDGSSIVPDDVDILNYLHDILYEFSSRRIKAELVSPEADDFIFDENFKNQGVAVSQEYPQFGGKVRIIFDPIIPVFNIKSIVAADGSEVLSCATTGRILSSADTSFENFKGFQKTASVEVSKNFKSKAKATKITTDSNLTFTIDQNWSEHSNFLWTMDDEAVISISMINQFNKDSTKETYQLLRTFLQSTNGSYVDFNGIEILNNKKGCYYKLTSDIYQPSGNVIHDTKIFDAVAGDTRRVTSLAVFADPYKAKTKYYEKIIGSIKLK